MLPFATEPQKESSPEELLSKYLQSQNRLELKKNELKLAEAVRDQVVKRISAIKDFTSAQTLQQHLDADEKFRNAEDDYNQENGECEALGNQVKNILKNFPGINFRFGVWNGRMNGRDQVKNSYNAVYNHGIVTMTLVQENRF